MESTMLYHLELLLALFVVLGSFYSIGTGYVGYDLPKLQVLATICLAARTNYHIQLVSIAVMAFVANALLIFLNWVMGKVLPAILCASGLLGLRQRLKTVRFLTAGIFLVALGIQCFGKMFGWQSRLCLSLLFAVYFGTIATAIAIGAADSYSSRLVSFAVIFFVLCPFLVAGKIIALWVEDTPDNLPRQYNPEWGLLLLTAKLLVPVILRVTYHHCMETRLGDLDEKMRAFHLALVIFYYGYSMFHIGQGYRAGDLLIVLSWLECFFLPLL